MGPSEGWWGQVEVFGAEERGMAWGEKKCGGVHGFYSEKWSQRVRERERDVLSFESFDVGFCVFIVCRGSRVVWSGGLLLARMKSKIFLYFFIKKIKK